MEKLVKVKLLKNMSWHDTSKKDAKKGEVVEVSEHLASLWISREVAEKPTVRRKKKQNES